MTDGDSEAKKKNGSRKTHQCTIQTIAVAQTIHSKTKLDEFRVLIVIPTTVALRLIFHLSSVN